MSTSNTTTSSATSASSPRDPFAFLGFTSEEAQILADATEEIKDDFRMHIFKISPCEKHYSHDWTTCPFAHPGEKAKRRDPRTSRYAAIACIDMKNSGICPRGDDCPYAHNVFEYWMHPTRYRTQICNDGTCCNRKICFFAHRLEELRRPPHKPGFPPEWNRSRKHKSKKSSNPSTSKTIKSSNSSLPNSPNKDSVQSMKAKSSNQKNGNSFDQTILENLTMGAAAAVATNGSVLSPTSQLNNNSFTHGLMNHHDQNDNLGILLSAQQEINYQNTVQQLLNTTTQTNLQLQMLNMATNGGNILNLTTSKDLDLQSSLAMNQSQDFLNTIGIRGSSPITFNDISTSSTSSTSSSSMINTTTAPSLNILNTLPSASQFIDTTSLVKENASYGMMTTSSTPLGLTLERMSMPQPLRYPLEYAPFPGMSMPEMSCHSVLSNTVADCLHFNCVPVTTATTANHQLNHNNNNVNNDITGNSMGLSYDNIQNIINITNSKNDDNKTMSSRKTMTAEELTKFGLKGQEVLDKEKLIALEMDFGRWMAL